MEHELASSAPEVKVLPSFDVEENAPDGWFRHVADSLVLTGLSRRWPNALPLRKGSPSAINPRRKSLRHAGQEILRTPYRHHGKVN